MRRGVTLVFVSGLLAAGVASVFEAGAARADVVECCVLECVTLGDCVDCIMDGSCDCLTKPDCRSVEAAE